MEREIEVKEPVSIKVNDLPEILSRYHLYNAFDKKGPLLIVPPTFRTGLQIFRLQEIKKEDLELFEGETLQISLWAKEI